MFLASLIFILVANLCVDSSHSQTIENETGLADLYTTEAFSRLTNPKIYNKFVLPNEGRPINVNVSLFMLDYGSIDEQKVEFSLSLLLRITWEDHRLRLNMSGTGILEGGYWHFERIWRPSLHVPNSKLPNVLHDSQDIPLLVRIDSDGRVLVSKRLQLEGRSQMDFRLYPLDIKRIAIEIESNELTVSNMKLQWNDPTPVETNEPLKMESYQLIQLQTSHSVVNYTHTGSFSRIRAILYFENSFESFLMDIYIPIVLYVVVSWTSFWIEIAAAPARVALGLTVMLTMVTTARAARDKLPNLPYVHSLEIWILISTIFVFATVVEFATVNYIYFSEKRSRLKKRKRCKSLAKRELKSTKLGARSRFRLAHCLQVRRSVSFDVEVVSKPGSVKVDGCEETAMEIDRLSRIIFPLTYFAFNLVYWIVIVLASRHAKTKLG